VEAEEASNEKARGSANGFIEPSYGCIVYVCVCVTEVMRHEELCQNCVSLIRVLPCVKKGSLSRSGNLMASC